MRHSYQNENHFDHLFINILQLVNAIASSGEKSSLTHYEAEQILKLRQLLREWGESHSRISPDSQLPFEMTYGENDEDEAGMRESIESDKEHCDAWDNSPLRLADPKILCEFNAKQSEFNGLIIDITGLFNKRNATRTNRSPSQGSIDGTTDSERSENSPASSPRYDGKEDKVESTLDSSSSQDNDPQLPKLAENFYFDNHSNQYWISHTIYKTIDQLKSCSEALKMSCSESLKKYSEASQSQQNNNSQLDEKHHGSSKLRQFTTLHKFDEATDTDEEIGDEEIGLVIS